MRFLLLSVHACPSSSPPAIARRSASWNSSPPTSVTPTRAGPTTGPPEESLAWCASAGVPSIAAVQPVHVATWIEAGTRELAAPSVKQRLAAIRHLFDWLVTGQVVPINPAGSVRGPRHVVTCGQTPVLDPAEARALLDSIDVSTHSGLRDRALIGLMVYSFARIGAALSMAVEDVYTQNRRLWVRLREKGGKRHAMPCHHNLEEYLTAYLDGA